MTEQRLWRVNESEADAAGAVLTRAFLDDPLFAYALPERAERARLCPPLFASYVRTAQHFGEVWAIGLEPGVIEGVIYWVALPRGEITPELSRQWGRDAAAAAWGAAHDRLLEAELPVHAELTKILPEPRRYIGMLGVVPERQGQGLGSALVARVLADASTAGLPVSTWTVPPRNVPFYRRAGFDLVAQGTMANGALPWFGFLTPMG